MGKDLGKGLGLGVGLGLGAEEVEEHLGGPTHVVAGSIFSKSSSLSEIGVFKPPTASSEPPFACIEKASVGEPRVALPMSAPRTSNGLDQSIVPD